MDGIKSTDLVIFEGSNALFIEVVAKRFNYITNLQRLDAKAIAKDIESMIYEKVKQLDRNIADFRTGALSYDGIDSSSIKSVYPVVATVVPVPQFVGLPRIVTKEIADREYLADVEALQFLAAEDLEMLVPAFSAGQSLSTILAEKIADQLWCSQSMRNYVVVRRPELLQYLEAKNPRWGRVLEVVRSWALNVF